LKFYAKQWDRYTTGATYVNKLFNYLNKHWVKREKDEGRKEVYAVYTVCLVRRLPGSSQKLINTAVTGSMEAELLHALRSDSGYLSINPGSPEADRGSEERRGSGSDSNEGHRSELW
jgi:hypothetical protein